MDKNKFMIGVDIGTTSTKAVLFRETGEIVHKANFGYELSTPNVSIAEQDPEDIFEAVVSSISEVMHESKINPKELSFISFSSAMHSVIAIDENDNPLTACITWADNRSYLWAEKLQNDSRGHAIYSKTGTPIHSMSPLSKIMWLENDHPSVAKKTKKYIGIKEYVFYKLFQKYIVDYSIASAMGLMNLESLTWDSDALQAVGITEDKLSSLVSTKDIITGCNPNDAKKMGISTETKFVIGASDGVLSNIGVGAINEGDIAVTIGTSGAIRTMTSQPKTDAKGRIFCYALTEDHWILGGPVNNGGIVLRWLRDELAAKEVEAAKRLGKDPYDILTDIADQVEAGSNGLLFHPYLAGERAPFWNPNMRGSFIGLTLNHKKEHMIRAVLEGVMFNLYSVLIALIEVMDEPVSSIKATGGFSQSKLWRQMMSDIFEADVTIPKSYESSCLGACLLGLYAEEKIANFEAVHEMVGTTYQHTPQEEQVKAYRELVSIFINTSRALEPEYNKLAKFQK